MPSGSRKKLLQDERCCSHSHSILTKLAEIDPRQGERLFESIALDALAFVAAYRIPAGMYPSVFHLTNKQTAIVKVAVCKFSELSRQEQQC